MRKTPEQLLRLIPGWFISAELQQDQSEEHYLRASIVLGVAMMSTFFAIMGMLSLYLSFYPDNDQQRSVALGISAVVIACYASSFIYYKFKQGIIGSSTLYTFGVVCATALPGVITGGFLFSPHLQLIIIAPVWAFLIAGRKHGIAWTVISILVVSSYYIAEITGVEFPQSIPADSLTTFKFIAWIILISLVVICLFIYEISLKLLTDRLHKEQSKLAHEAAHDPLTGLLNRKSLGKSIDYAIRNNQEHGSKAAILYIDLDKFKPINDSHGHAVGDEVLTIVTSKLKSCIRSSDTVARIGGDEFCVVLHNIEQRDRVVKIANQVLDALQQKIVMRTNTFQMSASIGVAFIPEDSDNIEEIISLADKAMYRAKRKRNSVCYSDIPE